MKITLSLFILITSLHAEQASEDTRDLFAENNFSQWWTKQKKHSGKWTAKKGIISRGSERTGGLTSKVKPLNFELSFEWNIAKGGNSGIKYRGGLEYQLLDDERHIRGKTSHSSAASLYNIIPPNKHKILKAAGQWNTGRIIANGNHLEHWLNGSKVLEVKIHSKEWNKGLQNSKYKDQAGFGTKASSLHLQDHGANIHFRKVHLRLLLPTQKAKTQESKPAKRPKNLPTHHGRAN